MFLLWLTSGAAGHGWVVLGVEHSLFKAETHAVGSVWIGLLTWRGVQGFRRRPSLECMCGWGMGRRRSQRCASACLCLPRDLNTHPPAHPEHPPQEENGLKLDVELTGEHLKEVVKRFKGVYTKEGKELPSDPFEQVRCAVRLPRWALAPVLARAAWLALARGRWPALCCPLPSITRLATNAVSTPTFWLS